MSALMQAGGNSSSGTWHRQRVAADFTKVIELDPDDAEAFLDIV